MSDTKTEKQNTGVSIVSWESKSIFPVSNSDSFNSEIFGKALAEAKSISDSNIRHVEGRVPHPYQKDKLNDLQIYNEHHSTCLNAKVNCTVGLGFKSDDEKERERKRQKLEDQLLEAQPQSSDQSNAPKKKAVSQEDLQKALDGLVDPFFEPSKVDDVLDDLCEFSFADLLFSVCMDFEHGDGYMEVVRKGDNITGIHHLPSACVYRYNEGTSGLYHYEVTPNRDSLAGDTMKFAKFGDKKAFIARHNGNTDIATYSNWSAGNVDEDKISEVIHFRAPNNLSRYYGHADWIAAIAKIELSKIVTQYKYDFYNNRGVAEFLLFFTGGTIDEDDWKVITDNINCNIGSGNKRKSGAINIQNSDIEIQLEKLGSEKTEDTFQQDTETAASGIVTAHRLPPLLANILIPGKLGATNELPNALKSFQLLNIGPRQRVVMRTLIASLGNPKLNGGLGLVAQDFTLRKITDLIDLDTMDTVSRMRQTLPEAQAEGRDISAGLKD